MMTSRSTCVLVRTIAIAGAWACTACLVPSNRIDSSTPTLSDEPLLISELMVHSEAGPDWVELYNGGSDAIDLDGLTLRDAAGNSHTIDADDGALSVAAGGYAVLAEAFDARLAAEADVFYTWTGELGLGANGDTLEVWRDDALVDRVVYEDKTTWSVKKDRSLSLDAARLSKTSNDNGLNWCPGRAAYDVIFERMGTPGQANEACALNDSVPFPAADGLAFTELMVDPVGDDSRGEWLELVNRGASTVRIDRLSLYVADKKHFIDAEGLTLAPGSLLIIATHQDVATALSGVTQAAIHVEKSLALPDRNGRLRVSDGTAIQAEFVYDSRDGWPIHEGFSLQISESALNAGTLLDRSGWCPGDTDVLSVDGTVRGTPGHLTTQCWCSGETCPTNDVGIFDDTQLHIYDLQLSPTDWQWLRENPELKQYVPATVRFDGVDHAFAAVRFKGDETLNECLDASGHIACDKPPIKISFVEGRRGRFFGKRRLAFNASNIDTTFLHGALATYLFREAGIMTSRHAFAEVRVNGQSLGLYVLVEPVDQEFLSERFADDGGNLYKEVWPRALDTGIFVEALRTNEATPDVSGMMHFQDMLETMDDVTLQSQLGSVVDTERLGLIMAADMVLGNHDGPMMFYCDSAAEDAWCGNHNYYWYEEPSSGLFHLIPWDFNHTLWEPRTTLGTGWWRAEPRACTPVARCAALADPNCVDDVPVYALPLECNRLMNLQNPTFRAAYLRGLRALVDGPLRPDRLGAKAAALCSFLQSGPLQLDAIARGQSVAERLEASTNDCAWTIDSVIAETYAAAAALLAAEGY